MQTTLILVGAGITGDEGEGTPCTVDQAARSQLPQMANSMQTN